MVGIGIGYENEGNGNEVYEYENGNDMNDMEMGRVWFTHLKGRSFPFHILITDPNTNAWYWDSDSC